MLHSKDSSCIIYPFPSQWAMSCLQMSVIINNAATENKPYESMCSGREGFTVGWIFRENFPEGRPHSPCAISCSPHIATSQEHQGEQPRTPDRHDHDNPLPEHRASPSLLRGRSSSGEGTAAVQALTAVCRPLQGRKEWSVMAGHSGSSSLWPGPAGRVPPC